MTLLAFFSFLASKVAGAQKWLKAYFSDENGQSQDASPENLIKFGKMKNSGEMNITNINLNLVVDPTSPEYSKQQLDELLREVSKHINDHSGLALGLDENIVEGIQNGRTSALTETQKNQIKLFTKAGWKKDKISSIITAYRIINAEEAEKYMEAKEIMDSAFSGRKKVLNRKIYNLARSGYLDRFAFDLLFSAQKMGETAIAQILNYFPEAIFLDQDFLVDDLNTELLKREREEVKNVSVYARGKKRMETMEKGYGQYLNLKTGFGTSSPINKTFLYMIERKMLYKIGNNEAETLDLTLNEFYITS